MNISFCPELSDEHIREEAYLQYVASGCAPGRDLENWLAAERELNQQLAASGILSASDPASIEFPLNADALRVDTPHPFPCRY